MIYPRNIILIGMPGSGKSTVGVLLAKKTGRRCIDTDLLIQEAERRTLQEIVDQDGYLKLRAIEEKILLTITGEAHIIATGGSAVYSRKAMNHLEALGTIVFLDVRKETLLRRVNDYATRGLAKRLDQSFDDLYQERLGLYRHYAHITIPCDGLSQEEVCDRILLDIRGNQA